MDIEDVNHRLTEIEREKDDFERAHGMQDALYREVLGAIAAGETEHPRRLARVALEAEAIDFNRYSA